MNRRKRLGQHYLVDSHVVEKMIGVADVGKEERTLEIGPGRGALTYELCKCTDKLDAYEIDRQNFSILRAKLGDKVNLHLGDVFRFEPQFDVLVSSLPYSMSSVFVEWLSEREYSRAVVLLQDEFVRKIVSPPSTKDYRAISAISQISSSIEIKAAVDRSAFDPWPKVNSMIVVIRPKRRLDNQIISIIKKLFSLRRRKLGTVLKDLGLMADTSWMEERVQTIPPEEVYRIASRLLGR